MHRFPIRGRHAAAAALLALAACHPSTPAPSGTMGAKADSAAVLRDIAYLASDQLEGRGTGTPGNDSAAAWITRRYLSLKLTPGVHASRAAFEQPFTAHSMALAHAGKPADFPTRNVVAILPGRDKALRGQYVVVGAHFDHLGRSTEGALDPEAGNAIRNGADDNASGTAAVLELARIFRAHPTRRSIVFANFSGEEMGLLGSQYFVEHPPVPLDSVLAMVNFDMVGRLRDGKLIVYGVATATELPAIVDSANVAPKMTIKAVGDGFGPSDHSSFYSKNLPVLHFFTDLHDDYHRASDDTPKINAGGEARVIEMAANVIRALGDRPTRLTFVRQAAPPPMSGSREGSNVYLGTIPDMGATDVTGLRITGVRAGSPAEKAGLQAGDVIVEFGGKTVKDLYGYSDALFSHKPGDEVSIVVLRNGARVTLTATLGTRGG